MKKRLLFVLSIIMIVSMLFVGIASAGPPPKVAVCHSTGDATNPYVLINISERAFAEHEGHGDASPGYAVPGMVGYIFDSDCIPEYAGANVTGQWDGFSGLVGNLRYGFHMYLSQDASGNVTGSIQYYINSTALRTVTGTVVGDTFTFRTQGGSYWADCDPCTVSVSGTHFEGTGPHSGSGTVGWTADLVP